MRPKIGRWILLGCVIFVAAAFKDDRGTISYKNDCNRTWIETQVSAPATTTLPKSLKAIDGCVYNKVYYQNEEAKTDWRSLDVEDRQVFTVKGKVEKNVLHVHEISHRTKEHQRKVLIYITKENLYNGCVSNMWEEFCFTGNTKVINHPGLEPMRMELTVDSQNNILMMKNSNY